GRLEIEGLDHGLQVVDRVVVAELLTHLLGEPGAALVVAQNAIALGEPGRDRVPAVERAAHLMQQHDRWSARPGKLIVDADSVGVGPRHGTSPPGSPPLSESGASTQRMGRQPSARRAISWPGSWSYSWADFWAPPWHWRQPEPRYGQIPECGRA